MKHEVASRDRMGVEHPLQSDACCRNTLYHAEPQNLIDHVPELRRRGVRHFRIELLEDVPQKLLRRSRRREMAGQSSRVQQTSGTSGRQPIAAGGRDR